MEVRLKKGWEVMICLLVFVSCATKKVDVRKGDEYSYDTAGMEISELYRNFYANQLKDRCSTPFTLSSYAVGLVEFDFVEWSEINEHLKTLVSIHSSRELEDLAYYHPFPSKKRISSFTALGDANTFVTFICLIRSETIECLKDPLPLDYHSENGQIKCSFLEDLQTKISQNDIRRNAFRLFNKLR